MEELTRVAACPLLLRKIVFALKPFHAKDLVSNAAAAVLLTQDHGNVQGHYVYHLSAVWLSQLQTYVRNNLALTRIETPGDRCILQRLRH